MKRSVMISIDDEQHAYLKSNKMLNVSEGIRRAIADSQLLRSGENGFEKTREQIAQDAQAARQALLLEGKTAEYVKARERGVLLVAEIAALNASLVAAIDLRGECVKTMQKLKDEMFEIDSWHELPDMIDVGKESKTEASVETDEWA